MHIRGVPAWAGAGRHIGVVEHVERHRREQAVVGVLAHTPVVVAAEVGRVAEDAEQAWSGAP